MARPRDEEKQVALLNAAAQAVSAQGIEARTASIARLAGVAEGTLFRYFATKDVLLNELYLYLKQDLSNAMRRGFVADAPLESRARSLWNGYVDWGIANPTFVKALSQLSVSDSITAETRSRANRIFPEVSQVSKALAGGDALADSPADFVDVVFGALADATMQFAVSQPASAEASKVAGFKVFWGGLTK